MAEIEGARKPLPLGESYNYLKRSLDNLQDQQSTGDAPPLLYPDVNPGPSESEGSGDNPNGNNGSNGRAHDGQ